MVLFQNCVRQLRSPAKLAATVQLRCYWKQLWSRWAITGSWEPLVFTKLGDIDLIFVIWAYNDELQIKFTFRSGPMIFGRVNYGPWTLKFGQIFSCQHLFLLCLEILTWFLVYDLWVYNDELQIKFTFRSSPMIFGRVMALELWNLVKYLVVTTLFHYELRYWLDFLYKSV